MHKFRLTLALFGFLLACTAVAKEETVAYRWNSVAIGGGGFVTGLVFHPREKGLAYARTDVGGAYRWDTASNRWEPLTDWIGADDSNLLGIESIAVDPSDAQRVYIAAGTYLNERVGNGAILRSQDRGRTFQRTDLPFKLGGNEMGRGNGERLAVDPNDGRVLFFGSRGKGLWRSADAGANWSQVKSFPAVASSDAASVQTSWAGLQPVGVVFVAFDPASGKPGAPTPKIYAGVSTREASVFESDDGGATWQPVAGQPVGLRPNHMVRASNGDFFLSYGDEPGPNSMTNGAVWKYAPASGRWTDVSPAPQSTNADPEGNGFGWGAVAVDARNPQVLVATTFNRFGPNELFRSVDGGASWKPVFARSQFDHQTSPWTAHATPHWMADIEINPFDADEVLFVTGYGIWASRNMTAFDDGVSQVQWWFKNTNLEETVPLDLISPPEGAHLLSAVGDIDGFRHDDLGKPTLQFAGPRLTNGESIAYAGQAPQIIVRSGTVRHRNNNEVRVAYSLDGGASWQSFASEPPAGDGGGHITIAADGKRVIWTPWKSGAWITADFGKHWQAVKGLSDKAVVEADRVNPALYYGFDAVTGKLYASGDGGIEFFETKNGVGAIGDWFRPELHPDPKRSGVVYLTASWRGVLRWSAGELKKLPGVESVYSMGLGKARDDGDIPALYVFGKVSGKEGLFRSDNEGRSWQRIDDDAHRFGKFSHVTGDPRLYGRVYFATQGRGIVYGDPQ